MRSYGENPTLEELNKMFALVDDDGSGEIDFEEFLYLMNLKLDTNLRMKERLIESYKCFNLDINGLMNSEELRQILV